VRLIGEIAEAADRLNHHPDVVLTYKRVSVELWTHDIGGLTERDFELAGEIDRLQC
jgi:4a-hydroxytetrahydrobiopterin dehydratase